MATPLYASVSCIHDGCISTAIGRPLWGVPDLFEGVHVARFGWLVLHSVKHKSVRSRKLHPFQKMSNSSGRSSLLALGCDIILKNLGRGWHVSRRWPRELWFASRVLVQINNICCGSSRSDVLQKFTEQSAQPSWGKQSRNHQGQREHVSLELWDLDRGRMEMLHRAL